MIAARGVGMRLRAVEQVIGLTEIFGQQLQTGEHLLHICGGRADGAAVETLRRVRIKRRLLPAGAADAACGLALIGLEKSGVMEPSSTSPSKIGTTYSPSPAWHMPK